MYSPNPRTDLSNVEADVSPNPQTDHSNVEADVFPNPQPNLQPIFSFPSFAEASVG
jgi:hypothetical protein